jgi:hypothetical protein
MKVIAGLIIFCVLVGLIPAIPILASIISWYGVLALCIVVMLYLTYLSDKRDYERKLKEVPLPIINLPFDS